MRRQISYGEQKTIFSHVEKAKTEVVLLRLYSYESAQSINIKKLNFLYRWNFFDNGSVVLKEESIKYNFQEGKCLESCLIILVLTLPPPPTIKVKSIDSSCRGNDRAQSTLSILPLPIGRSFWSDIGKCCSARQVGRDETVILL